jgi:hypothetical protein
MMSSLESSGVEMMMLQSSQQVTAKPKVQPF